MSDENRSAADAAIVVFNTLQSLGDDERIRVLQSAAALYGIQLGASSASGSSAGRGAPTAVQAIGPTVAAGSGGKPVSIVEFIHEKEPATNMQRIAVFAFFREHFEGNERFTKSDLIPYFARAKLAKPANFDRDYNGTVREGWIHDEGADSYLTGKGEAAVNAGFAGKARARGGSSRKKKATKPE